MLKKGYNLAMLWGLVLAALVVVGAGCKGTTTPTLAVEAPDFSLQTLTGEFRLSDFEGQPVLLFFWRIGCGACRDEMPSIQDIFDEKKEEGLVVLAINIGDDKPAVQQFIEEQGYTFPVGLDYNASVTFEYYSLLESGYISIPSMFFIDSSGVIKVVMVGYYSNEDILSRLESIMQ